MTLPALSLRIGTSFFFDFFRFFLCFFLAVSSRADSTALSLLPSGGDTSSRAVSSPSRFLWRREEDFFSDVDVVGGDEDNGPLLLFPLEDFRVFLVPSPSPTLPMVLVFLVRDDDGDEEEEDTFESTVASVRVGIVVVVGVPSP